MPHPASDSGESVATLASFTPIRLAARLEYGGVAPSQAHFAGAVLFADIVGFTQFVVRHSGRGEDGLETVSDLLNTTFARHVNEVRQSGGEIVAFAGDAFVAYWASDADGLGHAARAASDCAARLLLDSHRSGPSMTRLHGGLAAGALWAARVGNPSLGWQLVLSGPAVREAVAAHAGSAIGQIVHSESAVKLLAAHSVGDRIDASGRDPERPQISPAVAADSSLPPNLLPLVPRVVRERWGRHPGAWMAELRRVTPVFIRIDGLDESRRDALRTLQQVWEAIQDVVQSFSAEPGTLLVDDKGLVFLLAFGTPYNTHADDLVRAVRMALAIEARVQQVGLRAAMGVATGEAFCGVLGSRDRCQYAVVGPAMIRAARLMAASSGGLLCHDPDRETLRQRDLSAHPAGTLALKGLESESESLRVRACVPAGESTQGLCGRARELAEIDAQLDGLRAGAGGILTIVGDPGIGKTTLALESLRRAERRGIRTARGNAEPGAKISYGAWRDVIASILGLGHGLDAARLESSLREAVMQCGREGQHPLIGPVLGLSLADTKQTGPLRGAARADTTLQLLTEIVRQLAPAPMLLVLEDVHWMDSASWRLVERVAGLIPTILLVLTSRASDLPGLQDAVRSASRSHEIAVRPLDEDGQRSLVHQLLRGHLPTEEVMSRIVNDSGGSPLYVVERILLMREADGEGTRLPREAVVHESARAVITSRIDLLTPTQQRAVKIASVLGATFPWILVERLLVETDSDSCDSGGPPENPPSSEPARALERQRLVTRLPDSAGIFRFSHEVIRDVAYNLMLVQHRRHLHRRVALALEAAPSTARSPAALAHHWWLAGDADGIRTWSDRAGREALGLGAFEEAAQHFQRCLERSDGSNTRLLAQRLTWNRLLCDAYEGLGDVTARERHAREGLLIGRQKPIRLGTTSPARAFAALALSPFHRRLRASETQRLEISALHRHLAHVAYFESDGPGLFVATLRAVQACERCRVSPSSCGSMAELGGAIGLGGLHGLGMRYLRRAARLAASIEDLRGLAYVRMVGGLYLVGRARWDDCLTNVDECQAICEKVGDSITWGNAQIVRFWAAYYRGHFSLAGDCAAGLLSRAERTGNRQQEMWALRSLGLVQLQRGDPAMARSQLEDARRRASVADPSESVGTLAALGLSYLRLGEVGRAAAARDEALDLARKLGRPTGHGVLSGLSAIAELLWGTDDGTEPMRAAMGEAVERLNAYRHVFPIGAPSYFKWRGRLSLKQGRGRRAERLAARAVRAAGGLGIAFETDLSR